MFKLFDEDNTGYITFRNLKKICNDLGENLYDTPTTTNSSTDGRRDAAGEGVASVPMRVLTVPLVLCRWLRACAVLSCLFACLVLLQYGR